MLASPHLCLHFSQNLGHDTDRIDETESSNMHDSVSSDSSGETIYHVEQPLPSIPTPLASTNRAMLRDLEDKWDNRKLATKVGFICVQVKKLTTEREKRARETKDGVDDILEEISHINPITPKFAKAIALRGVLDALRLPMRQMSVVTNKKAQTLFEEFEKQSWGEVGIPTMSAATSGPKPTASAYHSTSRRVRPINASHIPMSTPVTPAINSAVPKLQDEKEVLRFGDDHPQFGIRGIMHGINVRINRAKQTQSYCLAKDRTHKRSDITGHNGHIVGFCVPYQINLVFIGLHGSSQGGMYGNGVTGAYSITVLSDSTYGKVDDDVGNDVLLYSGSGFLENTDPDRPKETDGTTALQTSALKKLEVRVIRGRTKKEGGPKAGFRYDGLYKIVSQEQLVNQKKGAYLRFKLVRLAGQPAIDTSRPTEDELEEYKAVKLAIKEKRGL